MYAKDIGFRRKLLSMRVSGNRFSSNLVGASLMSLKAPVYQGFGTFVFCKLGASRCKQFNLI